MYQSWGGAAAAQGQFLVCLSENRKERVVIKYHTIVCKHCFLRPGTVHLLLTLDQQLQYFKMMRKENKGYYMPEIALTTLDPHGKKKTKH